MQNFYRLSKDRKTRIFEQISAKRPLPDYAIEKDWWVVQTLRIVFNLKVAEHLVFKGGTSLSKAWNLIDRFSEDIDLAMDKKVLGIDQVKTKKQVKTLRSKSKKYISDEFFPSLTKAFLLAGFKDVDMKIAEETENDPLSIEIYYPSIVKYPGYIRPRVLIEIGCRSLKEPFTERSITSFVTEEFAEQDFADVPITIPTALPERTFLEKIFLLHEEFQKENIRANRLTRHLYDIERIMNTPYAASAIGDHDLYQTIVQHRKLLFSIGSVNYNLHQPQTVRFIPPSTMMKEWEQDYNQLNESMIYGEKLSWNELISRLEELTEKINKQDFRIDMDLK